MGHGLDYVVAYREDRDQQDVAALDHPNYCRPSCASGEGCDGGGLAQRHPTIIAAQAARREKVSEQSIGRWKAELLKARKAALAAGKSEPSSREAQMEAEVAELTQSLGETAVEIRVWKKSAEGRLGPSPTSR